ncbi:MAG: PKD domain-containing protein [Nitrospira sp.]|nr:PKD domain-containing protein [Nitrospira sp.]MDH4243222.1 PKD domain-containing protein [Nitrospira sp.]MDH4356029.1 PKD domain-containing protein [Nitrospira sp.]MDH5317432.1 PKD domain-containing protein [Nitrospira sp.]
MNVLRSTYAAYLTIAFMALSACSGGEGAPDTTIPGAASSLVADAGRDQSVFVGTFVTLNGSKSINTNQTGLTYAWTLAKPAGSNATLSNPSIVNPTLTVDVEGTYEATLLVRDAQQTNLSSAPDTVLVLASKTNPPPAANAGDDRSVFVHQPVVLSGSGSRDANNDPLTFNWNFTSVPAGSNTTLFDSATVAPSFAPDVEGPYTLQLVVNDKANNSTPDSITITASHKPSPTANAGADQFVPVNHPTLITLKGNGSRTNPPTNPPNLDYTWTINSSTFPVALTDADKSEATFGIPANTAGTVTAQLKVTDKGHPDPNPKRNSRFDTVNVNVGPLATISVSRLNPSTILSTCTITSCEPIKVQEGSSIQLDGSASQGQPSLIYEWVGATPAGRNSAVARFESTNTGDFMITLTVRDGRNEDKRQVTLSVVTGPIIDSFTIASSVLPNTIVPVTAKISGVTGLSPECTWEPSHPNVVITDGSCTPTEATATISASTSGSYLPRLTVSDSVGGSGKSFSFYVNVPPTVTVSAAAQANTPATGCTTVQLSSVVQSPDGFPLTGSTLNWTSVPTVSLTPSASVANPTFELEATEGAADDGKYSFTLTVTDIGAPTGTGFATASTDISFTSANAGHNLYHSGISGVTNGGCVGCHRAGTHDIIELSGATNLLNKAKADIFNKLQNGTAHGGRLGTGSASDTQAEQLAAFFATVGCLARGSTVGH